MIDLGDIIRRNARRYGEKEGVVCIESNRRFTYAEFNQRVNRLTNALLNMGVSKGERVAMFHMNCVEYLEFYCACAKGGFVATPILFRLAAPEVAHILEHSDARVLLVGTPFVDLVTKAKTHLPTQQRESLKYICIGGKAEGMQYYDELCQSSSSEEPQNVEVKKEEDIFLLAYTSGTTGKPKGAMITHKHVITDCINHAIERRMPRNNISLNPAPMSHIGVTSPTFTALYTGGKIILMSYEPRKTAEIIEKENVTHVELFPALIYPMLELPDLDKYDFSSLQSVLYGASTIAADRLKKAIQVFQCGFFQLFGMTEAGPTTAALLPEDHVLEGPEEITRRLAAAGRETLNVEAKLVDEQGREIPRDFNTIGEVILRGDVIMEGYWKDPEATEEVLRDGWYYTGDLAKMDDEGYIYIVDRKKDMIITGGENVSSAEVESVLYAHPAILEAAIIGIPDRKWGEAVKAVVVLREDQQVSEEDVITFCKENLTNYKCPKSIAFVNALPRNAAGKVLKKDLRVH